jgi:hypothetical protein
MSARLRRSATLAFAIAAPFVAGCAGAGSLIAQPHTALPPGITPVRLSSSKKVLYVGDSLSLGAFGDGMQAALIAGAGPERVALYASCGSAAQHWLSSEPQHFTPCGYRETTPAHRVFEDFHNGAKPHPMPTPKIESLMRRHHPTLVIVQLGTNHFDNVVLGGLGALPRQEEIFEEFANAIQKTNLGEVPQVVWILPPDSAHFPAAVQAAVADTICKVAGRHGFLTIDSRRVTHYVNGKTGADGIHYRTEAALAWAAQVIRELNRSLFPRVRLTAKNS